MRAHLIAAAAAAGLAVTASDGRAATAPIAPAQSWSFSGMFGTFDRGAAQRGLQVYQEVCAACHSLDLVAFRNLRGLGLTEEQVEAIAADYEIEDGPDDQGDMFTRPGRPADRFPAPFPNEQAARAANNNAYPPDLSVITKARAGESLFFHGTKLREYGADYVYGMLVGYKEEPPEGYEMMDGMYYNEYFPGHQIGMAPPLYDEAVEYADGTEATLDQHARDVTTFLAWAADPNAEERKRIGVSAVLFTILLTGMLFALKKKIWSDIH